LLEKNLLLLSKLKMAKKLVFINKMSGNASVVQLFNIVEHQNLEITMCQNTSIITVLLRTAPMFLIRCECQSVGGSCRPTVLIRKFVVCSF